MTKETLMPTQTAERTPSTTTTAPPDPDAEGQTVLIPGDPPLTADAEGTVTGGETDDDDENEEREERRR